MSDGESEKPAARRLSHKAARSAQRADHPADRPRRPLARFRDPFDDLPLTIRERRLTERRVHVQERSPVAPFLAESSAEELLTPDNAFALDDDERDALLAELIAAAPARPRAPLRRLVRSQEFPWRLFAVCVISLVILSLVWWWGDGNPSRVCLAPGCIARTQTLQAHMVARGPAPPTIDGQHSVLGPPSISAQQIDRILAEWRSPAAGTGAVWVELGVRYGIDPAYALAFFIHESGAGTAPGWAGRKPNGGTTHNIGNIICAGYRACYGRFRDYASWEEGIEDWYRLIAVEYVQWRGVHTVEEIVPIYAPAVENNVPAYIDTVNRLVAEWRASQARP